MHVLVRAQLERPPHTSQARTGRLHVPEPQQRDLSHLPCALFPLPPFLRALLLAPSCDCPWPIARHRCLRCHRRTSSDGTGESSLSSTT